jgi:molybdopterin synthase sulfur carrier subunit
MNTYKIELFGRLKDELGFVEKEWRSAAGSPAELWQEVTTTVSRAVDRARVRPVINDAFAAWDDALKNGDRVAFLPPSSGG